MTEKKWDHLREEIQIVLQYRKNSYTFDKAGEFDKGWDAAARHFLNVMSEIEKE